MDTSTPGIKPITAEELESKVAESNFVVFDGRVTVVSLKLHSGFVVTGESICHDPAKFDGEVGQHIATQNAIEKLFQFEAYAQAERGLAERMKSALLAPVIVLARA